MRTIEYNIVSIITGKFKVQRKMNYGYKYYSITNIYGFKTREQAEKYIKKQPINH